MKEREIKGTVTINDKYIPYITSVAKHTLLDGSYTLH